VNDADVLLPFSPNRRSVRTQSARAHRRNKISEKMVKTYLRYVHEEAFGIVSSSKAPTITDASGKFAFAPAIHEVFFSCLSFLCVNTTNFPWLNLSGSRMGFEARRTREVHDS
jgi:hypothetical protein